MATDGYVLRTGSCRLQTWMARDVVLLGWTHA